MYPYMVCLFLIIIGGLILENFRNDKKYVKIYLALIGIAWIVLATFRANTVGVDTIEYLKAFHKPFSNEHFGFGYNLLCAIFSYFQCSDSYFLGVIALIIYIPVLISIYRYSESPWMSVMMFFCLQFFGLTLSAIRQMIALSILLLGIEYILKRNFRRWLMICFLASLFHNSSVCMIPAFWFLKLKDKRRNWYGLVFMELLLLIMSSYLSKNISFLIPNSVSYYRIYLAVNEYTGSFGDYIIIGLLNMFLFLPFFLKQKRKIPAIVSVSIGSLMMACIVLIVSLSTGNIVKRLNFYYLFFLLFFCPWTLNYLKAEYQIKIMKIVASIVLSYYFYHYAISGALNIYPYKFSF